jgi:hypothetical protein
MEKPFGAHVFWLQEKDKEVPYAFLPVSVPEEGTLLFNMSIHEGGSGSPHHCRIRILFERSLNPSGYGLLAAYCILHFTRRQAK